LVQVVLLPGAGAPPNIYFNGGDDNDTLSNMMDPEEFDGMNGWDTVTLGGAGGGGNDVLKGWDGSDTLDGGLGNDLIDGGALFDTLNGNDGNDTITGGPGTDIITGGNHDDTISGGPDTDSIHGDSGNDTINGDDGGDLLWGDAGNDVIQTGISDAWSLGPRPQAPGGPWWEIVFGGDGMDAIDAISATGRVYIDGGWHDDLIYGSAFADEILGGGDDGWDTVFAGDGNDIVHGEGGDDELYGEEGGDTLWGHDGDDLIAGGDGPDVIHGGTGSDVIWSWHDEFSGPDQPYVAGADPNPGWPPIKGTGEEHCDSEDGTPDD
jgi:Ca2+-binding RTX toxin-like protein